MSEVQVPGSNSGRGGRGGGGRGGRGRGSGGRGGGRGGGSVPNIRVAGSGIRSGLPSNVDKLIPRTPKMKFKYSKSAFLKILDLLGRMDEKGQTRVHEHRGAS
eukprot:scaffold2505_cov82-Skeletonema_dohrnii-CCMP3373.AAC.3